MNQTTNEGLKVELFDVAPLREHELHRCMPRIDVESGEWHGFVDGLSGVGPEGCPPIYVTSEGFILDGYRRWRAAKQLGWEVIPGILRQEWEAGALVVESLVGQRSLSKGAKVYLITGMLPEYVKSAEIRRLSNLKRGVKTTEKALFVPKSTESTSGKGIDELCERLGCGRDLYFQAARIRRFFELPNLQEHRFEFQNGAQKTLKEHFEPLILGGSATSHEHGMGLGEVLKGIGWFVDENGKPKNQAPPERNSHLHYFERAWENFSKQCGRWEKLGERERSHALELMEKSVAEWPEPVLAWVSQAARKAMGTTAIRA